MTDYFLLLDEPRRPWLDSELLKKKFLTLSGAAHPDRVHNAPEQEKRNAQHHYTELNQAYNNLRSPKERLHHFLELETGEKPQQVQQVPPELMDFFFQVGNLFKQTDAFLADKSRVTSPLLQVQLFGQAQSLTEELMALQKQLNDRQQVLLANLKELDEDWTHNPLPDPEARLRLLRRAEELYRLFAYFSRWEAQIQEKIVRLSL